MLHQMGGGLSMMSQAKLYADRDTLLALLGMDTATVEGNRSRRLAGRR
jgi:hypothetical protein